MWTGTLTRLVAIIAVAAMGRWAAEVNGPTAAQETPASNRPSLSLDGAWKFLPDLAAEGEARQLWKPANDALPWRDVAVPSVFEAACPPQADARPLSLTVRVRNAGNAAAEAAFKLGVKDSTGKPVILTNGASCTVRVGAGESADFALKAELPGAIWNG